MLHRPQLPRRRPSLKLLSNWGTSRRWSGAGAVRLRVEGSTVGLCLVATDYQTEISELDRSLTSIEAVVDPTKKRAEIDALSEAVAAPDLWDDPDNAQKVTSRLSALNAEVARVSSLRSRLDDLGVLVELAQEEADPDTFFTSPQSTRAKDFLGKILTH